MPPKKPEAGKKTQEKVKAKIVEDKTFGLKNKKGSKQQKFIQQVQKQVTNKLNPTRSSALDPNLEREKKKEEEKKKKEELSQLFKPVAQTVAKGVDPKSVVCIFFKQGLCQKGDRCKFSHDLAIERKAAKRNIYEDTREADGMENWDDAKLEDVVNQKHGEDNIKKTNSTQIVCKYFIEAVENKTYGWFWSCPNGDKCMYKHALPPGFTLKSEAKKKDQEDEISLEMLIEKERASLGTNVTKVTLESFIAWKARKLTEKKDEIHRKEEKKRSDFKLGFHNGLTGRDLFTFNPDLIANDDEDAQNDIDYKHRADDDDIQQPIRRLDADTFAREAKEVDDTGTIATNDRFSYLESMLQKHDSDVLQRRKEREEREAQESEAMACASNLKVEDVQEEDEGENEENDQDGQEDEEVEEGEEGEEDEEEDDDLTEEEHKNSLRKILNDKTNSNTKDKKSESIKTESKIEIDESLFNLEELADIEDELEQLDI